MKKNVIFCASCKEYYEISLNISATLLKEGKTDIASCSQMKSQPVKCKTCGTHLVLTLAVQVIGVEEVGKPEVVRRTEYYDQLPTSQRKLLFRWRECGLLSVLEDALFKLSPMDTINHRRIARFVFKFIQQAERIYPRRDSIKIATGVDEPDRIKCWVFEKIAGITIDGWLRCFVPVKALENRRGNYIAFNGAGVSSPAFQELRRRYETEEGWIKTRFGYVVGRGELFDEVQRHIYTRNSNYWPIEKPEQE